MAANYTLQSCEECIDKYVNRYKGEVHQVEEGVLGLGTIVLTNGSYEGVEMKSIIIKEFYINAWESGHKVRKYNKLPKKYQKLIENL
jgi:hypothetical protein